MTRQDLRDDFEREYDIKPCGLFEANIQYTESLEDQLLYYINRIEDDCK